MSAPKIASGTEPRMMMNGSRKLLNCAARTKMIKTTASMNRRQKFISFFAQKPRVAGVIQFVALLRQNLARHSVSKNFSACSQRHDRDAAQFDGVQLLETVQRARRRVFFEMRERADGNQLVGRAFERKCFPIGSRRVARRVAIAESLCNCDRRNRSGSHNFRRRARPDPSRRLPCSSRARRLCRGQ